MVIEMVVGLFSFFFVILDFFNVLSIENMKQRAEIMIHDWNFCLINWHCDIKNKNKNIENTLCACDVKIESNIDHRMCRIDTIQFHFINATSLLFISFFTNITSFIFSSAIVMTWRRATNHKETKCQQKFNSMDIILHNWLLNRSNLKCLLVWVT